MNLDTAIIFLRAHYAHADREHPTPKTYTRTLEVLEARVADLADAYQSENLPDYKLIAGKRALQVAALALRAIQDLELGLVGPDYDSSNLPHTPTT
jgi:hypothetical protein